MSATSSAAASIVLTSACWVGRRSKRIIARVASKRRCTRVVILAGTSGVGRGGERIVTRAATEPRSVRGGVGRGRKRIVSSGSAAAKVAAYGDGQKLQVAPWRLD